MLEAGRLGEMVYLAATAYGLGACGIGAIFDDEARTLLALGDSSALLYLVAAGPVKSDGMTAQ
jgi:nitroreductase